MFLKPEKLQNHSNEGKGKEKKKQKQSVAFLVFIIATLEIVFGWKKLLDAKGPFGDNVIKNPARYILYFSKIQLVVYFNAAF